MAAVQAPMEATPLRALGSSHRCKSQGGGGAGPVAAELESWQRSQGLLTRDEGGDRTALKWFEFIILIYSLYLKFILTRIYNRIVTPS